MHPLRPALSGLFDYAGLYPPASLNVQQASANMLEYAGSDDAWMLGRFIVPFSRLEDTGRQLRPPRGMMLTVSVTVAPSDRLEAVASAVTAFNDRHEADGVAVVAVERIAGSREEAAALAAAIPSSLERYAEVPIEPLDAAVLDHLLDAGVYAKLRAGGLTADRIPSAAALATALAACASRRLPLKLTAGLHHPLRGRHALTYDEHANEATMHGFVNVLLACALLQTGRAGRDDAIAMLNETDASAIAIDADALSWRDRAVKADELWDARALCLRSIGSCSFEEPVDDLRRLGWLPSS